MFSYNIAKSFSEKAFADACSKIESHVQGFRKEKLLEDFDGTKIQIYNTPDGKIKVYNDFEVDAVYVDSEVNLSDVL